MSKRMIIVLVVAFVAQLAMAQEADKKYKICSVGFYNLENLFDTINDPETNDEEFLPEGKNHWTSERYHKKLDNMSYAISRIGDNLLPIPPMILGISEIENRSVVEDLVNHENLKKFNYQIVHHDSPDRRGVDVALIYNPKYFSVTNVNAHRLDYSTDTSFRTRDQLVVSGIFDGEPLHIIVCHWPSRRGGESRSRPLRNSASDLSRSIIDSIQAIDVNAKIILMGDLNDDPNDVSLLERVNAKGEIADVDSKSMFNPYYNMYKHGDGSLAYRDAWNNFDQIMVSPGLLGSDTKSLTYKTAKIYNANFLTNTKGQYRGYPFRTFSYGSFIGGYSDHYPVYIILVKDK